MRVVACIIVGCSHTYCDRLLLCSDHHLVEKLGTDHKVVPARVSVNGYLVDQLLSPDALRRDLLEVLGHDLLDLVQEAEQQRHVAVGAAGGHTERTSSLTMGTQLQVSIGP